MSLSWRERAACRDKPGDLWMVGSRGSYDAAREVCYGCPVRCQCLDWALQNSVDCSLYGGLSPRQRQRVGDRGPC